MTEKEAYKTLVEQAPNGYRINELIKVSYPVRKVRISALVNKAPDENLIKVYNVLLRAIELGFDRKESLFAFLGLQQTDEFILRELFLLRERGLLDLVSEKWYVTEEGKKFVKDNAILRVEENEEYEFLIDGVSGKFFSSQDIVCIKEKNKESKFFDRINEVPINSSNLLKDKFQELSGVYKQDSQGKAYLINYDDKNILFDDNSLWIDYWFVEYISKKEGNEPYIEIRSTSDSLRKNDVLSKKCNNEYWQYVSKFTDSDRKEDNVVAIIQESQIDKVDKNETQKGRAIIQDLTIWETKQKFIESLQNVKEQILIESPWIKRATLEYLQLFKNLLKDGKKLIILYGIDENSEHDSKTLKKLEELQQEYESNFTLIELSEHLKNSRQRLTGTHRKLLIKDNDYFISGSFNFLSFAKQEGQQVANEESHLITIDVNKKWEKVIKEYSLLIEPPKPIGYEKKQSITAELHNSCDNDFVSQNERSYSTNLNIKDIDEKDSETNETWFADNKKNPKRAVIELSTKAVKLLVNTNHEIIDNGGFSFDECFLRKSDRTETGQCLDRHNHMNLSLFSQQVLPSIIKFVNVAKQDYKVDVIHTVATAAYRTAENRGEILALIKEKTGLNVQILSKKEEAQTTLWAYNFSTKNKDLFRNSQNILMMDIGGGSSEISIFKKQLLQDSYSLEIGTTALKNRLFNSGIADIKEALQSVDKFVNNRVQGALRSINFPIDYCVGVGRPITIATGEKRNEYQHDYKLTIEDLSRVLSEKEQEILYCHSFDVVKQKTETDEFERILVTRIGLPIVIAIMDFYKINEIKVNGTGLFYGVFFEKYFRIGK